MIAKMNASIINNKPIPYIFALIPPTRLVYVFKCCRFLLIFYGWKYIKINCLLIY